MKTTFLSFFKEFDRKDPKDQISLFGYSSEMTINEIKKDKKINKPVELTIFKNRALLTDGNHRLAVANELGIDEMDCTFIKVRKLDENLKARWHKSKKI